VLGVGGTGAGSLVLRDCRDGKGIDKPRQCADVEGRGHGGHGVSPRN